MWKSRNSQFNCGKIATKKSYSYRVFLFEFFFMVEVMVNMVYPGSVVYMTENLKMLVYLCISMSV